MSFGIEKLIVYRNLVNDEILKETADIIREFEADATDRDELISRIYNCINKLLAVSTENGFDNNLWQNYLTYLLVMDENPFALSCEKEGDRGGSVVSFVLGDFAIIKGLFHYDFTKVEEELGINCFSVITNYKAIKKADTRINKNVSDKVKDLSRLQKMKMNSTRKLLSFIRHLESESLALTSHLGYLKRMAALYRLPIQWK